MSGIKKNMCPKKLKILNPQQSNLWIKRYAKINPTAYSIKF